jgi:iron(III) transport system substrate-binding protein
MPSTPSAVLRVCIFFLLVLVPAASRADGVVNIYSYREPKLIEPLLQAFTAKTGIETKVVFANSGLVERITAEGQNSPADLLLTNESGLLFQAVDAGITASLKSDVLEQSIPAELRDPQGRWFGLTRRARIVYAAKDRVSQDRIRYEDLSDPKWRGRICIRSGQHTYNVALVAAMIAHLGAEKAEAWLTGLRDNLARKPAGGDREQVRDVHAGLCDLAVGNTYYMVSMLRSPSQKEWTEDIKMIFPDAADWGTHINISGMALLKHAPNMANAKTLMTFLVSPEAQRLYADIDGEYPVISGVKASEIVESWGPLKADRLPLSQIAELRQQASEMIDRVRFDSGPQS